MVTMTAFFVACVGVFIVGLIMFLMWTMLLEQQRRYKKMHVNLVESVFFSRTKQLEEIFTKLFELCSHYTYDDDDGYQEWLIERSQGIRSVIDKLDQKSKFQENIELIDWFAARNLVLSDLKDFSRVFLFHTYFSGKNELLFAEVSKYINLILIQDNELYLSYFEDKSNVIKSMYEFQYNERNHHAETLAMIEQETALLVSVEKIINGE